MSLVFPIVFYGTQQNENEKKISSLSINSHFLQNMPLIYLIEASSYGLNKDIQSSEIIDMILKSY